jgi:hypothetical protein
LRVKRIAQWAIQGCKETAPAGGGLGPVEPVRDVPNGRERHGHTILGNADCSSAPAAFFCEPARRWLGGRLLLRIGDDGFKALAELFCADGGIGNIDDEALDPSP